MNLELYITEEHLNNLFINCQQNQSNQNNLASKYFIQSLLVLHLISLNVANYF